MILARSVKAGSRGQQIESSVAERRNEQLKSQSILHYVADARQDRSVTLIPALKDRAKVTATLGVASDHSARNAGSSGDLKAAHVATTDAVNPDINTPKSNKPRATLGSCA